MVFSGMSDIIQDVINHKRHYWMALSACWGGMLFGWDSGLIGGILPRASFKRSFGLDVDAAAYANVSGWVVSVLQAGCFFGAMSAAFFGERFGRKPSIMIAAFFFHLGSVLQTAAATGGQSHQSALDMLYIGRAIGGFGVGLVSCIVPTYISESAPKHIRGRLTGMYQLSIVVGIALSFWINYAFLLHYGEDANQPLQWRIPFSLQLLPGVLLVVTMAFEKESPRWLAERGRWEESRKVIARLHGLAPEDELVVEQADAIRADLETQVRLPFTQQVREIFSSKKTFYRASLPFIFMFWQQWTGVNSMNYYSPVIFQELGLTGSSSSLLGTGIYGVVKVVMTAAVLSLGIEQFGRKALLFWGGLGQAIPMFYIAGYRQIREGSDKIDGASYVAIVMIYLYVSFYSLGWSAVPWPAMSESVPNHLRSLTMAVGLMSNWGFNFMISKLTPILLNEIKWGTYFLFGCTTLGAVIWSVFFYPETGGYAIEDIHALFEGPLVARSLKDCKYLLKPYKVRGARYSEDNESQVYTYDDGAKNLSKE